MIVLMEKGTVKWAGTSTDFLSSPHSSICKSNGSDNFLSDLVEKENNELESSSLPESDHPDTSQEQENVEEETRKEGRVEFGVYK
jgi:ATP-binding cassette, subfamily C (CFTR/MRP), member 10